AHDGDPRRGDDEFVSRQTDRDATLGEDSLQGDGLPVRTTAGCRDRFAEGRKEVTGCSSGFSQCPVDRSGIRENSATTYCYSRGGAGLIGDRKAWAPCAFSLRL